MFQTVHVVSIDDVTTRLGIFSFHEKLVSGAPPDWLVTFDCWAPVKPRHRELQQTTASAREGGRHTPDNVDLSVNLCPPEVGCLPTKLDSDGDASFVYSHTLKESPVVASSSVDGDFCVHWKLDAALGCHCRLVAGYPWFASTSVTKSG